MHDLPHYAAKCLKIRPKQGPSVPFLLNRSQRYLHERIEAQRERTGKVRVLVLKGRQIGISTYVAGRFYWRTTHGRGLRSFILAHLDDASENLFNLAKRFHENCPELVRPATGKANAKELSFELLDSGYKVATAGSKSVGRSDTIQLFHGSEVGFWPNAEEHFAGVGQAVAEAPGTEMILESTANGIGNVFHSLWKRAERGESEFEAVFVPWFWHEEYTREPEGDWQAPLKWAEYQELHGLTDAQVYWAWLRNRDLTFAAGGDAESPCPKFQQEYPATSSEAFETSGANAFISPLSVLKARKAKVEGYGPIILGVDPARGGRDKTGIVDRQGRRIGGHVCKRVDYGENTMAIAADVVREYHRLLPLGLKKICVDTTGLGGPLYDRLTELLPADVLEPVNFGSQAHEPKRYANRRAEMWDKKREWYDDPAGAQVPDNDEFQGDETSAIRGPRETHFRSNGQLVMEDKESITDRLTVSPDLGDAAALTFAPDMDALHAEARSSSRDRQRARGSGWAA